MGQIERKAKEKEFKRKDIIDAAERVIFAKGYDSASMDDVAKEAQYSKRTVYVYFNSKEQIYYEIMIRGYRILTAMLKNSIKEEWHNAREKLRSIFFTFMEFSNSYPEYFKAIIEYETKDAENQTAITDESKAECYRLGEVIFDYLRNTVKEGVAEGTIRSELDSKQAALILWASTIGVYNTAKNKGKYIKMYHDTEPNEFISQSFEIVMKLLSTDTGDDNEKNA